MKAKIKLSILCLGLIVFIGSLTPVHADSASIPEADFGDKRSLVTKFKDAFQPDQKKNSIIIKLKDGSAEQGTLDALGATKVKQNQPSSDSDETVVVKPAGLQSDQQLLEKAKKDSNVEYAEVNHVLKANLTPSDTYYPQQWYLPKVKANQAWDVEPGGLGPVAVIDTGVQMDHPDLASNMLNSGYDFVNADNDPSDDNGHGTFVAGIISAVINNGQGAAGISKNAPIIPLKVLDANGEGYESDIALAIRYAADNGAKVINLSLSGNAPSMAMEDAITYADSQGAIVVASAGNEAASTVDYPAAYPAAVAVGSTNQSDQKSGFSNWGTNLDVMAPGEGIISTYTGSSYASGNGTSASAPIVSGALSLIMSGGNISKTEALSRLKTTSDKVGGVAYNSSGYNSQYGYGRINLLNLINNTVTSAPPQLNLTPVYRFWSGAYNHHFYTASEAEKNYVMQTWPNIWAYESIAYYVAPLSGGTCPSGLVKIYRFWSGSFNGHFYTASEAEKNYVMQTWPNIWAYEGPQYCVSPNQDVKLNTQVYRFWSGLFNGHFYTASATERNYVMATWPNIWTYEGGVFWVSTNP